MENPVIFRSDDYMVKPTITIGSVTHEIKTLTGKDWRILGEFLNADVQPKHVDYLEKHAEFIANFFDGVTTDDILNLPIGDIMPLYSAIQRYFTQSISTKLEESSKNVPTDGAA